MSNPILHSHYAVAVAMLGIALLVALLALALDRLLATSTRPDRSATPEQGAHNGDKTWVQFRVRYAVLALLFVAFDMEMVFMFPWAVAFRRIGMVAFLDMFVFIAILAAAIAFAWKEGALDWER